ncbi:MAG: hypothetical protein KDC56_00060, partial [Flavobacteriaceae bacterium]|nr:hypothetical protein [Flavobacteriaceae bacterium]
FSISSGLGAEESFTSDSSNRVRGRNGSMLPNSNLTTCTIVSGAPGSTNRLFLGHGDVWNTELKDELSPVKRLKDDYSENSTYLIRTFNGQGFGNCYLNAVVPNFDAVTRVDNHDKWLVSCWYNYSEDYFEISGNFLLRMSGNISQESLNASTERGKWLYHEFLTDGSQFSGRQEISFGAPQPVSIGSYGYLYVDSIDVASERFYREIASSGLTNGWTIYNAQVSGGLVLPDTYERLAYYNSQAEPITKISSRETGRIGVYQNFKLDPLEDYHLDIVYKNANYGEQNLLVKSESFHQQQESDYTVWATGGAITLDPGSYVLPVGFSGVRIRATRAHTTTSGSLYLDNILINQHNMTNSASGRQFSLF